MEALFPLSSLSKQKISEQNGSQPVSMATGGLIATQRDGQAMIMVWSGSLNVLNLKHVPKQ
jgi:hypothetical protein